MAISLKWSALTVGALLTVFSISSISISAESKAGSGELPLIRSVKDPVASVDGKVITEEDLRIAVNNVMPMRSFHTTVSDDRFRVIRKQSLDRLINDRLIYNQALAKNEAKITDKEFNENLEALKKRLRPDDTLEKALKRSNMTMDELREDMSFGIVVNKQRLAIDKRLKKKAKDLVNEKYMKAYYSENLAKFKVPAELHLRGILLRVDPSASQRVWNEAKKKIKEISREAKGGADFAGLAKKYSQSNDASLGGDMGWAHEGSLLPDIEGAVSRLKVGEISGAVMSIYGVHLFKLEGKRPSKQLKFTELDTKKLKSELVEKEYKLLRDEWVKGLHKGAKIKYIKKI